MFCFSEEQKIEFRDANDISRILHTHSVAPHLPGKLCTATPSTMLYDDGSKDDSDVHWLDLSDMPPKPATGKGIVHTQQRNMKGMCFVQNGDKQLLIATEWENGSLFAYNTETDKQEWEVKRKLPGMEKDMDTSGVTTDGRGHLFVGDKNGNKSIQMFSVSDGVYLGCLMKDVDAHGAPARISWCESKSSLVAAFFWKGKWHLKVINVQF